MPFSTAWLGRNPSAVGPAVLYAVVFSSTASPIGCCSAALVAVNGRDTPFGKALAVDIKGYASLVLYLVAIGAAFFSTIVSDILIVMVGVMWLIPDRRFEPLIDINRR